MGWDVQKCIDLHNRIVAHACSQLPPKHQPAVERSWFAAHSLDLTSPDLDVELDDDIRAFLSGVDIVVPEHHQHLAFNPMLVGIVDPHSFRHHVWDDLDDYDGLLLLYKNTGYDPGGLVYDCTTQQVAYMDDAFEEPRGLMWADLHNVLQIYWDCIDSCKFLIDPGHAGFGDGDNLVTQGWRIEQCTKREMDQVLDVWGNLVDAIARKLPASVKQDVKVTEEPKCKKRRKNDEVLICSRVLDMYPSIPPFVRAFLSRAKKPPFKSIAPQLDVPDEDFIHRVGAQMQKRYPDATLTTPQYEILERREFLLFPWRTPSIQLVSERDQGNWQQKPRSGVLDNRAGLYIHSDVAHSHSSTLLLPFAIGGNGHVLQGDDIKVDKPGQDVLYNHGMCNPFLPGHGTPLAAVLVNWWEQVENGDWAVNENGVARREELWKMADTVEGAQNFAIEWACF